MLPPRRLSVVKKGSFRQTSNVFKIKLHHKPFRRIERSLLLQIIALNHPRRCLSLTKNVLHYFLQPLCYTWNFLLLSFSLRDITTPESLCHLSFGLHPPFLSPLLYFLSFVTLLCSIESHVKPNLVLLLSASWPPVALRHLKALKPGESWGCGDIEGGVELRVLTIAS